MFGAKRAYCTICRKHVSSDHSNEHRGHKVVGFGRLYRKADPRDYRLVRILPLKVKLPDKFDLRDLGLVAPVGNQGTEGSCTGFAYYAMKAHEKVSETYPAGGISARHIYNAARALENRLNEEGAYPEDCFKYGLKVGVCRWETWPYVNWIDASRWPPPQKAIDEAPSYRISAYARLNQEGEDVIENIKQALYQLRSPVYMGTPWPDSWMSPKDGILPTPTEHDAVAGGHAWVIVAWNDLTKRFTLQNSWGRAWPGSKEGFADFSYEAFPWFEDNEGYEAFKAIDAESPKPDQPKTCDEQLMTCFTDARTILDYFRCVINYFGCRGLFGKYQFKTSSGGVTFKKVKK